MSETINNSAQLITNVSQRSTNNITEIKSNLISMEGTINKLSEARNKLIDAIILDAAEAINYWQNQIKTTKELLASFMQSFVDSVKAQEMTIAALELLKNKTVASENEMKDGLSNKTFRQWPARWGTDTNRLSVSGEAVNVDTSYPSNLPTLPVKYQETATQPEYSENTLRGEDWLGTTASTPAVDDGSG